MDRSAEIAVVGGGPSGMVAALSLASAGAETVLFAPPAGADRRTTALLHGSVRILEALHVWTSLAPHAAPLSRLRLVDASDRLIRAPEVTFDSRELGLAAFGYNVENEVLYRALRTACEKLTNLHIVEAAVDEVATTADVATLRGGGQEDRVRLVVAADGRHSTCRRSVGIVTERRAFPQTALALNVRHARRHENTSTEFHAKSGPFTLVPLPGERSSLVWVVDAGAADELMAMDDRALSSEIERRAHSILGAMQVDGERGRFPLSIEVARSFGRDRIALVGEAGHVLPPIGAQGLNLGMRDAATIAELAADALRVGRDPGGGDILLEYETRRRKDVRVRALAVEMMNRSLLSDFLPVHVLRGSGLQLASRFSFLRRTLMREGIGPREELTPRLARGRPL